MNLSLNHHRCILSQENKNFQLPSQLSSYLSWHRANLPPISSRLHELRIPAICAPIVKVHQRLCARWWENGNGNYCIVRQRLKQITDWKSSEFERIRVTFVIIYSAPLTFINRILLNSSAEVMGRPENDHITRCLMNKWESGYQWHDDNEPSRQSISSTN